MQRTVGRRPVFFAITALISLVLVPATPPEFRWVAYLTAGLGGFWAVALGLQDLLTPGGPPRAPATPTGGQEMPLAPPPPPGRA
jgi:hypothetical protein